MQISGLTRLFGLIGDPVAHSFSPLIHNTAFSALNMDAVYLAFQVIPENLAKAVQGMRALDICGMNITMPHKESVLPLLDEISDEVKLFGAVNTVANEQGKLIGYNTDGHGYRRALARHSICLREKRITVLGAGGAATAIVLDAAMQGAQKLFLFNRTIQRVERLAQKASQLGCAAEVSCLADQVALKDALQQSDLLINATSLGMGVQSNACPLPNSRFLHAGLAVMDAVYLPRQTRLLRMAQDAGCYCIIDGLSMLYEQGAAAFEIWTGKKFPDPLVWNTLEEAANAREQCASF